MSANESSGTYPDPQLSPQEARERFLQILGPLGPPTVPLNVRKASAPVDLGDGLRQEKLTYEVDVAESVPAYLYTHEGNERRPAVIALHPHGGDTIFPLGKEYVCKPSMADTGAYAYRLARAGFVVLAPDSLCFGERREFSGFSKNLMYEVVRTMELMGRGRSLTWKNTWDIMRAVDLLQSLPMVAPERIGLIGHSGGSIQTYIAMPCDERIRAAVALQSFITLRHQFYSYRLCHCLYPYVPNIVTAGIDYDQLVASIVPRKLFMGWGRYDDGTPRVMMQAFVDAIEAESKRQNVESCVELFVSEGGHDITEQMLDSAIAFLRRELAL